MDAPAAASRLAKLKQQFSQMKVAFDNLKETNAAVKTAVQAADAANKGKTAYIAMNTAFNAVTEEDMVRLAAQIASILDPTGVSDTVASFSYAKCSKYGFPPVPPAGAGTVSWTRGPAVPANAVIGGGDSGRPLPVCRASYQDGVHPGKVWAGNCNIGWGGKEIVLPVFDVLVSTGAAPKWVFGPTVPPNFVTADKGTVRHWRCAARRTEAACILVRSWAATATSAGVARRSFFPTSRSWSCPDP